MLKIVNPCLETEIVSFPSKIDDIYVFAGSTAKSSTKYKFSDTLSVSRTSKINAKDFCGDKLVATTYDS